MTQTPPWTGDAELARLFKAIEAGGGEARIVGGAVRDFLLKRPLHDIDVATTLPPKPVRRALERAAIRTIPTGMDHGTVTALLNDRSIEVTTLRQDVETDGRHAVVRFTTDWRVDALRRDFTINTLSSDLSGVFHDPLGTGLSDLEARRLKFAGDAEQRIHEDYLRILRFFRFRSVLDVQTDAEDEAACARTAAGLESLSAERIWQEMRKLLSGPNRQTVLQTMHGLKVLAVLLPEARADFDLAGLPEGDPILALADLLDRTKDAGLVAARWKISSLERKRLSAAMTALPDTALTDPALLKRMAWRDGNQALADRLFVRRRPDLAEHILHWLPPALPVRGQDLLDRGVPAGREVGVLMRAIETWWLSADFAPDRTACLSELDRLIGQA